MKKIYNTIEDVDGLIFEESIRSQYKISRIEGSPRVTLTQVKGGDHITSWDFNSLLNKLNDGIWKIVPSPEPNYEIY